MRTRRALRRGCALWVLAVAAGVASAQVPLQDLASFPVLAGPPLPDGAWGGVPTVLVFWSVDCAYCKRHNARIAQLQAAVDPQRLRVLSVLEGGNVEAARQEVARRGWQFPVLIDDGRLRARFTPRRMVPMTCLLVADGRLHQCIPGEMSEADVTELAQTRWAGPAR